VVRLSLPALTVFLPRDPRNCSHAGFLLEISRLRCARDLESAIGRVLYRSSYCIYSVPEEDGDANGAENSKVIERE